MSGQKDVVLNVPLCSWKEIQDCQDPLSQHKVITQENGTFQYNEKEVDGEVRPERICERGVPGACPRIRCAGDLGEYHPCRMLGMIQTQSNESGFWMKLPCSQCPENRELHPRTKEYVYSEYDGGA